MSKKWPDNYVLKFGTHQGKPLDAVPLVYLDWLLGQSWFGGEAGRAVAAYLSDPAIARELEKELDDEKENEEGR